MKCSSVYIEITNSCNLNCRTCYNASGANTTYKEISPEMLEVLFNKFSDNYIVKEVTISGGEPLLHKDWQRVLDVMERYESLSFLVITNGTIRDEHFYDLLINNNRFEVQFSLDGADEETNSRTRGRGAFAKCVKNIRSLELSKNKPIMKMVLSRFNVQQIENYYALCIELNCLPSFAFVEKLGNAKNRWETIHLSEAEKIYAIETINELNARYNLKSKLPLCTFNCPLSNEKESLSLMIKSNGDIQPCQNFYSESSCIGSIYNFNINDLEYKLGLLRRKIRRWLELDFGCNKCLNRSLCNKGCPSNAFSIDERLITNDGNCKFRQLQTAKLSIKNYIKQLKGNQNV